jgi:hypothetical protein
VGVLREIAKGIVGVPKRDRGVGERDAVKGGLAIEARSWSNEGSRSLLLKGGAPVGSVPGDIVSTWVGGVECGYD